MKKLITAALFLCAWSISVLAQSSPPIRVTEADGSPSKLGVTKFVFDNGTVTITGNTARVTGGGGGGGTVTSVSVTTANGVSGSVANATTTPAITLTLGAITPTTVNGLTVTTTTGTFTVANGKTLTASNTLTLAGTDSTTMTFPATSASIARTDAGQTFIGTQAFGAITASGAIVQTSTSAAALESGPSGSTNPVFRLVNNVPSATTGLSITGNAAGSGVTLTALSNAGDEGINIATKGNGQLSLVTLTLPTFSIKDTSLTMPNYSSLFSGTSYVNRIGYFGEAQSSAGGFSINGFTSNGSNAGFPILISGYHGGTAPTTPAFRFSSFKSDGVTSRTALTGSEIILTVEAGTVEQFRINASGNVGIGATAFGTSGAKVFAIGGSTAPSTSPADVIQAYSGDGAAGAHELYTRNEAGEVERQTGLAARVTTQFDKTNTTLATVTGLSRNVESGRTYSFRAVLHFDADLTGGGKFAIEGTATATSVIYEIVQVCNASNLNTITSRQTALAGSAGQAGCTAGVTYIDGTIVVNAGGTLIPSFAQNAASGTSSVLVNSSFVLHPIS